MQRRTHKDTYRYQVSYNKYKMMYHALQSCMMYNDQNVSQLNINTYRENFNYFPRYNEQYYQQNINNISIDQQSLQRNQTFPETVDRTTSYISDPSFDLYNVATSHSMNYTSAFSQPRKNHIEVKPPYSYAALICMAIESVVEKKATMPEIIHYIECNFPYYRSNKKWHGTIRHDLTVNDCFVKLSPRTGQKACLWAIDPQFQDMFSKGNFRRRRYRFKKGSNSWLKTRKQSADKRNRHNTNFDSGQESHSVSDCSISATSLQFVPTDIQDTPLSLASSIPSDYSFPTLFQTTSTDHLTECLQSTTTFRRDDSPSESKSTAYFDDSTQDGKTALNDILSIIPDFQDCVDELYQTFQNDYFMST